MMRLLILLAAVPLWASDDAGTILKRWIEAQPRNDQRARQCTYVEQTKRFTYEKNGQLHKDRSETSEVLFGDGVRVLARVMKRVTEVAGEVGTKLRDRSRSVKLRAVEIARVSRSCQQVRHRRHRNCCRVPTAPPPTLRSLRSAKPPEMRAFYPGADSSKAGLPAHPDAKTEDHQIKAGQTIIMPTVAGRWQAQGRPPWFYRDWLDAGVVSDVNRRRNARHRRDPVGL